MLSSLLANVPKISLSACKRAHQLFRLFGEYLRCFFHAGGRLQRDAKLARNDVYVEVEHDLAAGAFIELLNRDAVGRESLHARLGDLLRHPDDVSEIVGKNVENVARRRLRQHERMTGSARHDIKKGEGLVVFVDLVARQFAAQNLREDIVWV